MLRNIRLLYLHNFFTDFCPHWPFQIIFFSNIAGSYTAGMSVLALETFSSALFDIPAGAFSDRLGRRWTLVIGSISNALAMVCYTLAPNTAVLYVGAVLVGLAHCLFSGNNNALLYESLKSEKLEDQYHHYRGIAGSMFQLALCLSALLSVGLSGFGFRIIFAFAAIPQFINIFVGFLFVEPRQHMEQRPKNWAIFKQALTKTWRNKHLLWLVMARAINYGSDESLFQYQNAFINLLWPTWALGIARAMAHALSFIGFRISGRLIEKFREPLLFIARDIYWFATGLAAFVISNFVSPFLILSGAIFFGPGEVASDHLMQKEFSDEERATMGSISSSVTSVVFALVSLCLGGVADTFGAKYGYLFGVCCVVLSLPINLWLFRKSFKA